MKSFTKGLISAAFAGIFAFSCVSSLAADEEQKEYKTPQELIAASQEVKTEFKEGEHYKVIPDAKLSEKKEMKEFFSFFCGHCNHFLPYITLMDQSLPEDAYFVGVPVHYLGGPMGPKTMRAYAAATTLQIQNEFAQKLFHRIFNENKIPQNDDDLAVVFEELGIPKHKFLAQYNSFPVANMANQYKQNTEDAQITGVPAVVINNKYQIVTSSVKGEAEYFALVQYLLNKDNDFYNKKKAEQ